MWGSGFYRSKGFERDKGWWQEGAEDTGMWLTRKILPTRWRLDMRVGLIAVVLCVSACSGPGASTSNPSGLSPEGGSAGPMISGDGDGGSGM